MLSVPAGGSAATDQTVNGFAAGDGTNGATASFGGIISLVGGQGGKGGGLVALGPAAPRWVTEAPPEELAGIGHQSHSRRRLIAGGRPGCRPLRRLRPGWRRGLVGRSNGTTEPGQHRLAGGQPLRCGVVRFYAQFSA
jgi:hypothetical protein